MTYEDVRRTIAEITAEKLEKDVANIPPDARLREDLGVDSLTAVEIVWEIEEKFGMELPRELETSVRTVKDLVDFVAGKVAAGAANAST
ncbi:MAG: acyl carrier protein [Acidobacteria bacterium]|nr:acyl carrier protein [Acidobacteriota bacterium]